MVKAQSANKLEIIRAKNLSQLPWLVHGFSTRKGGFSTCYGRKESLNLGITAHDTRENVERNRELFLNELGAEGMKLVLLRQVHSDIIHTIDRRAAEPVAGDGLITKKKGLLLSVRIADCYPIILADTRREVVGVFHAGWRGTLARIVQKGIGEMRLRFGTEAEDIEAAIGPGIGSCCYKVGEELRDKFLGRFSYGEELFHEVEDYDAAKLKYPMLFLTQRAPGHSYGLFPKAPYLDLAEANRRQLVDAGVPEKRITVAGTCTACHTRKFFSHRKENGVTGRMMAVVGIR